MTSAAVSAVSANPTVYLQPKQIVRRAGWNPRFTFTEIDELMTSIRALKSRDPGTGGLLHDIRVRAAVNGTHELVDGDRRLTAIEQLIKEGETFPHGIPCKVESSAAEEKELLLRMFVANSGVRLLPLEEAAAFKRMRDLHMSIEEIAKETGRSMEHVASTVALVEATPELQEAVKTRQIKPTQAKQIARATRGDPKKQKALVEEAKAAGKDKAKRKAVDASVEKTRRERAEAQGRVLAIKPMATTDLSRLGSDVASYLVEQMADLGLSADADLEAWLKASDPDVNMAFTYGALQALKSAAGVKEIKLFTA